MKQNLYFQEVYGRKNVLMEFVLLAFFKLSSYPRMVMEVLIRKNFGERYFSIASALTIIGILFFVPTIGEAMYHGFFTTTADRYAWYLFVSLFASCSVIHWLDGRQAPGTLNFGRFSKYAGDIHPLFRKINLWGWTPNERTIETILEPAVFLITGLLLHWIGFAIGMLLIVSSIFYSLSYFGAYQKGDNFIKDMIDQEIINMELDNAFVLGRSAHETRGVKFY